MFTQFRVRYPKGSIVTELSGIDHGKYIVRCLVQDEGTTLVTSLAAAETVEQAEDKARSRVLAILGIDTTTNIREQETPLATNEVATSLPPTPLAVPPTPTATPPMPTVTTAFSSESHSASLPTQFPDVATADDASSLFSLESTVEDTDDEVAAIPVVDEEIPFSDNNFSSAEDFTFDEVEIPQEVEVPSKKSQKKTSSRQKDTPAPSYSANNLEPATNGKPVTDTPIDFSDIIARTNVELKRLGWTNQQGRDYLIQTYGKRSRQLLSDDELLDFLSHLENEPTPGE